MIFLFISFYKNYRNRRLKLKSSITNRFRKEFKLKNRFRDKLNEEFLDKLVAKPNSDIKISIWDKDYMLREKAAIHRARLIKYGQSKMNGEMFYREPDGNIYKYTINGHKEYI